MRKPPPAPAQSASTAQDVGHDVDAPSQRNAPQELVGVVKRASAVQLPGLLPLQVPQAPHVALAQQTPLAHSALWHA